MCVSTQIDVLPGDAVAVAADTLKLVADPTRLRILWTLLHGEHSVGELASHIGAQPANVSQHLAKLRLARLVRTRRDGNHVFYVAEDAHVRRLVQEAIGHATHVVDDLPDHEEDAEKAGAHAQGDRRERRRRLRWATPRGTEGRPT
jgi:DNA-binding transcriptional ArsR family regulator